MSNAELEADGGSILNDRFVACGTHKIFIIM